MTWIANNRDDYKLSVAAGATVGGDGNATVKSITFAKTGRQVAQLRFTADDALTDKNEVYVALTATDPIVAPLPSVVQPVLEEGVSQGGVWRTVVRENDGSYSLCAEFRKGGLLITIR